MFRPISCGLTLQHATVSLRLVAARGRPTRDCLQPHAPACRIFAKCVFRTPYLLSCIRSSQGATSVQVPPLHGDIGAPPELDSHGRDVCNLGDYWHCVVPGENRLPVRSSGILLQSASLQAASASTLRGSYSANWSPTHRDSWPLAAAS